MVSYRSSSLTLLSAAAGAAVVLIPVAAPADAAPGDDAHSRSALNSRVDRLYHEAEVATEKYNGARERAGRLREQAEHAQDRLARGQGEVNRLRRALGAVAGAQYRSGGIDPTVELLLSSDPAGYLERAATLDRIGSNQSTKLDRLDEAQRGLARQRSEATARLGQLEREQRALREHKRSVREKLGTAQRLLNRMSPRERAERERPSRSGTRGVPDLSGAGASSARAASAVAAAQSAIGSPYVFGAAGPGVFDCSGLMQWAYARAGVALPRTSQAQAAAGRSVPLSAARPGDLVVYRDDASHIGMYAGGGQVIHAPYPGAVVRYESVNMMPVHSVVRP
ncbi:NlpC/P60 family protein [Streptomyces sp. ODS28]|uniref:C40 family peptidase n=1 Tax=Streptomyces sp. ODS28 TaxID=3136688 RepID=UPI0031E5B698